MLMVRRTVPLLCVSLLLMGPSAVIADEGEKVFQESCTSCHNAKTRPLDKTRLTREKWKEAVERMEGMGTEVPGGKKLSSLLDYLEQTHGPDGSAPAAKDEEKK
ncbi:MAG TPA: cytochrome c [Anaeromyxobacteraceae bacterium]